MATRNWDDDANAYQPEKDPGVFVCLECKSDQNINPYKNIWVQDAGIAPPCRYCGGVVVYLDDRRQREAALHQADVERGISGDVFRGQAPEEDDE